MGRLGKSRSLEGQNSRLRHTSGSCLGRPGLTHCPLCSCITIRRCACARGVPPPHLGPPGGTAGGTREPLPRHRAGKERTTPSPGTPRFSETRDPHIPSSPRQTRPPRHRLRPREESDSGGKPLLPRGGVRPPGADGGRRGRAEGSCCGRPTEDRPLCAVQRFTRGRVPGQGRFRH